jgi:ABC-type proline/glycine betaine transport system ATPase subunit
MREGRVVQIGRPREVYENPSDEFVADFLKAYDMRY